jgi:hypothetical protein
MMPNFNDETIEKIFGADDAENESLDRFLAYFYYNQAYESLASALPIRVLVGHKGVGKSAVLKRAFLADQEEKRLCIWVRPNDLISIKQQAANVGDFIARIEAWKEGILREVIHHVLVPIYGEGSKVVASDLENGRARGLMQVLTRVLLEGGTARSVTIYIDDIDRGWSASPEDIKNISALLNALRDIAGENSSIRFRIGLRSDVYFLVRTSDESTDKIERNVVWLRWNNDEILRLMALRIETFFGEGFTQEKIVNLTQSDITKHVLCKVIVPRFEGKGHWSNRPIHHVLLSLTRARPRDLVKLFHGAARRAHAGHSTIIQSQHLEQTFERYSQERLQDVVNEFRSEMPDIEKLLLEMKPSKRQRRTAESYQFTTVELSEKLENIMGHVNLRFTNGRECNAKSLKQFLYKIDFITARRDQPDGTIDRKYFDESRFLANEIIEFGYNWEIHPAYRWALQPQDISDVFESLD